MGTEINATKCPKCGGATVYKTAFDKAQLDDLITCPSCKRRSTKREFLSPTIAQSLKIAQDVFRDIPGFKIKK